MQDDLDDLLALAARRPVLPSQPAAVTFRPAAPAPKTGLMARLASAFGGPPALAGLGTAAVFGLALGYYSPATLDYLTGASTDTAEFFPEADFLTTEG